MTVTLFWGWDCVTVLTNAHLKAATTQYWRRSLSNNVESASAFEGESGTRN